MSETSRPFNGTSPGDSGPYSATQWQQLYQSVLGLGASRPNVGPMLGSGTQPNDGLKVQAKSVPTTSIDVLAGSALVQGIGYISTATVSFVIAANSSGNPRIDTVVLRADYALQTVRLAVLQGTPAASPSVPSLTQSANVLWEIPIADIAVANAFTSITNANITPRHEWANAANGVYLDSVLNNSGGTLVDGDVVIWDSTTDRATTTTTTADDKLLAGVWRGRTANGSYGRVQVQGVGYVNANAAITRGAILVTSTSAKQAAASSSASVGSVLGIALETTSGSGFVLTHINAHKTHLFSYARLSDQKSSGTAATSLTAGAWRTRDLQTEDADPDSIVSLGSNQMTIQPGIYLAWCTAQLVSGNAGGRLRLRNTTDSATLVQGNNAGIATGVAGASSTLSLFGTFILTAAKVVELQHWPSGATGASGSPQTTGDNEVYAEVLLMRIGES